MLSFFYKMLLIETYSVPAESSSQSSRQIYFTSLVNSSYHLHLIQSGSYFHMYLPNTVLFPPARFLSHPLIGSPRNSLVKSILFVILSGLRLTPLSDLYIPEINCNYFISLNCFSENSYITFLAFPDPNFS
jgi:hypothetical protein